MYFAVVIKIRPLHILVSIYHRLGSARRDRCVRDCMCQKRPRLGGQGGRGRGCSSSLTPVGESTLLISPTINSHLPCRHVHVQFFGGAEILNVCDKKVRQQQTMEVFYLQYLGDIIMADTHQKLYSFFFQQTIIGVSLILVNKPIYQC